MGEAKRRREEDPNYGRPKGRGLIVVPPLKIDTRINAISMEDATLNPSELRLALLFFDRLVWPQGQLVRLGRPSNETNFLVDAGVLEMTTHAGGYGDMATIALNSILAAYNERERKEPGCWAICQSDKALQVATFESHEGRSIYVELHRAIPVPDNDVPLAEVLEFKARRRDELLALRSELDEFYSAITKSPDTNFELRRFADKIDAACADVLKMGKEWRYGLRLSDLRAEFELSLDRAAAGALVGFATDKALGLPGVCAALGAAGSMLKWNTNVGFAGVSLRKNPYRYVHHIHDDLFV